MATTEIRITAVDNEIFLLASQTSGSSELLHFKAGYGRKVDIMICPREILPPGEYSLTMIGVNWGGPTDFTVVVVTDGVESGGAWMPA